VFGLMVHNSRPVSKWKEKEKVVSLGVGCFAADMNGKSLFCEQKWNCCG
jgi:alpha-glucosidase (family GH31 glycosyl hydrolase)